MQRFVLLLLLVGNGLEANALPCRLLGQEEIVLSPCLQELDAKAVAQEIAALGLPTTTQGHWFRIDLDVALKDGLGQDPGHDPGHIASSERLLDLGIPDAYRVRVYLQQHASLSTALSLDPASNFSDRVVLHHRLIAPLPLQAGSARVYVYFQAHDRTPLFARLLTPAALTVSDTITNLINGLIFGTMLILIPILPLSFSTRQVPGLRLYGAMVLANILLLTQLEGYLFAFIWPNAPAWNMLATGLCALLVLQATTVFSMVFLNMKSSMPRLYRLHQLLLGLSLLIMLLHLLFTVGQLIIYLMACLIGLACVSAWQGVRLQIPAARLYLYGVLSSLVVPLLLFVFAALKLNPFPWLPVLAYPKMAYLCKTLLFGAAVISQLRQVNARQLAQRMQLLAESEQLLQAEFATLAALEKARLQQLQLASASHDLAQPLASLRFAIDTLDTQHMPDAISAHIRHTLQYTQSLLKDLLEQAQHNQHAPEQIRLASIFAELEQSFQGAVREKKLRLSIHPSTLQLSGSALLLHRILNNLLANAVRYTSSGRILLGARRRAGGVEIQVLDTGPGIPLALQHTLLNAFQRADADAGEGYGLGLFIVSNLCRQCKYELRIHSQSGRGSCFAIFIPHA